MKKFTDYTFHMHTEIVFGRSSEKRVAEFVRKYGGSKVMLVYGGGSIKKIGLYDIITSELNEAGISFVELSGVQPNPRRSLVEKGLKTARDEKIDFLLGVGGGSSIDTAKAIALGLANGGSYMQFFSGIAPLKVAPVGAIPTISAAGSETSGSGVLLDDIETHRKISFMHSAARPVFALMNPELTYSVSPYQTGVGAADIFAHVVMRYFIDAGCYLGDQYCEGTLRTVVKYAPIAYANPTDYEARAELMLAGSFSHNDLLNLGRYARNRGGEHGLEKQLSGFYDTPHGAGLAAVMPAWMQYIVNHGNDKQVKRVAQFGINVFDVENDMSDVKATANEGLRRFRAWLKSIGMPLTLKELGIPKEDLADIVSRCVSGANGVLPGFIPLGHKAVTEIFSYICE